MRAEEFLEQIKALDILIENKRIEMAIWHERAKGFGAFTSSEKVLSTKDPHRIESVYIKCLQLEKEIEKIFDNYVATKAEVIQTIEMLKPKEYDVLHKVYVQYKTLAMVARDYDKSYSWATTIHSSAKKHLQAILDKKNSEKV